ncbi:hypothetical protein ebA6571 [Aromatoleum aromaticum EbN1]|uniref:Uncharacterized protein n=1 Tax=Aromatoleum aromaticum (strain DSM 19018 / LMG 30748 / EbN1) TaxID=76114 RepID=Q5NYI3_AROAE|nr:hypothetical protein ebA6571 [Aromatoleum aromaticum EbN1]
MVLHGHPDHFNGFCVHFIVFLVGADEFHVDDLQPAGHGHDQPVVVAFDVENDAPVLEDAGAAVLRPDV